MDVEQIVRNLKEVSERFYYNRSREYDLFSSAAKEIERLQKCNEELREEIQELNNALSWRSGNSED